MSTLPLPLTTPESLRAAQEVQSAWFDLANEIASAAEPLPILQRRYGEMVAREDGLARRAFEANPQVEVACRAGCGTCCGQWVGGVRPYEIEVLARAVADRPGLLEALHERVEAHDNLEANDPDQRALEYFALGMKCPLLGEDQRCTVYAVRPSVCREFFSATGPENCTPEAVQQGRNRNFLFEPKGVEAPQDMIDVNVADGAGSGELLRDLFERLAWSGDD